MSNTKPALDLSAYNKEQVVVMFLCPVNRHGTKEEHGWCSDQDLFEHPEWLVDHFEKYGGAKAFAARRGEFTQLCEDIENCVCGSKCKISGVITRWTHCIFRTLARTPCMQCEKLKKHLEETTG